MTHDSAALRPRSTEPARRGIHLAYSRSWRMERRRRKTIMPRNQTQQVRPIRESHTVATLSLGIAALAAPAIWICHAILHWMHVL